MLWQALAYKGWLETRWRLLIALAFSAFFLISAHSVGVKAPDAVKVVVVNATMLTAIISSMLAGGGIATQPAVQATKGIHGSILFTLSLPVTRFRLLAVRAGLGWLEAAGALGLICCAMWIMFPLTRAATTGAEMIEYAGVLIACASSLHFIGVLLATFLDDLWRMFGSLSVSAMLWWLPRHTAMPVSADIFRAMGEGSPLLAHSIPWLTIAFSLELAAILFFAALKVAQWREY